MSRCVSSVLSVRVVHIAASADEYRPFCKSSTMSGEPHA
jgi:hypothetical protein